MSRTALLVVLLRILILTVLLSGCYQVAPGAGTAGNTPATPTRLPNLRPANTIVVDGSAIVGRIIRSVALGFVDFTPGYNVEMGTAGTRDGFRLFCDDQTDIQGAVRAMDADESADCTRNSVTFIQLTIAFDALAVIGDAPVQGCISASELTFVYSKTKSTWQDVRAGLPATPVAVFAPMPDAAAAQFFAERVLLTRCKI
jgi:phosphate transport system substrate-binding protein